MDEVNFNKYINDNKYYFPIRFDNQSKITYMNYSNKYGLFVYIENYNNNINTHIRLITTLILYSYLNNNENTVNQLLLNSLTQITIVDSINNHYYLNNCLITSNIFLNILYLHLINVNKIDIKTSLLTNNILIQKEHYMINKYNSFYLEDIINKLIIDENYYYSFRLNSDYD